MPVRNRAFMLSYFQLSRLHSSLSQLSNSLEPITLAGLSLYRTLSLSLSLFRSISPQHNKIVAH